MTKIAHEFQRLYVNSGDTIEQWGYTEDDIVHQEAVEDPRYDGRRRCLEVWVLYEKEIEE